VGTEATVILITTADGGSEETYNAFDVRRESGAWKFDVAKSDWAPTASN
jgi:hypothetical protein